MAYLFSSHSFSPPIFQNESVHSNAEDHFESWKYKFIDYWSSYDTLFWILSELYKLQVQNPATLKLEHFVHTRGCDLKRFSKEDFRKIIPQYGEMLYYQLHTKLRSVTDEVWRREMVAHHLHSSPGPSSSAALEPFNMAYFDQPLPHHAPSSTATSTSDTEPKHWPPDRQDYECWAYKHVVEWTPSETLDCLVHELFQLNINPSNVNLDHFREVNGRDLVKLTLDDFKWMLPDYGEILYHQLQPKIKSNIESKMPWSGTHESGIFSHKNLSHPFSYAHRQELPYAHPSCFRWKPERTFPGRASDNDSVLNLSREHTSTATSVLSSENVPLEGTSLVTNDQNLSLFDHSPTFSRSQSSISKSNFSILSLTKDDGEFTSTVIKQEKDSDPPLKIALSDSLKKFTEDFSESSPSHHPHIKDSDLQDSCSDDTNLITQDSLKDSVVSSADSVHTKGMGSCLENSVLDHGYNSETNDEMPVDQEKYRNGKEKRKPGRPRSLSKKDKAKGTRAKGKVGRVWEFIRDLIMDPSYNPSVISWEDREKGLFRFRSGDQVAKLWGCKRGNPRMNFENFSRSIRQNYKKGYLLPVEKIRLVYQFGPRSTGWRPGDPPTRPISLPASAATIFAAQ